MISKVLLIADPIREAIDLITEALGVIHSEQLQIKAFFISHVSGVSLRNFGPNIHALLRREEEEALQRAKHYFTVNSIPYDIRIVTGSDRDEVWREIKAAEYHVLIIQGEFADVWRKDLPSSYALGEVAESANPVWILKGPEESSVSLQ